MSMLMREKKHGKVEVTHSQLLEGLKSESKYKTTEGGRIGARSLATTL
jgi:hypothetical protein